MSVTEIEKIFNAGVVGAGGAGFPTHVKLENKASVIIANGAECEPLLRVDRQTMEYSAKKIVKGMKIVMKITSAELGIICLKGKYSAAINKLTEALKNEQNIKLKLIDDYYPAGDEQQLVFEATNKIVNCGGLPIEVGTIVCNVNTLVNISNAIKGAPVTERLLTVAGEVEAPMTLSVPIGTPIEIVVEVAGLKIPREKCTIIVGGPAMGEVEENWKSPVTKTLGGIIVLPSKHPLVINKKSSIEREYRIAKSACCQCNFCTDLCPRNALGLKVEPHKVMRAINYDGVTSYATVNNIFSCCNCGICTLFACNMGLSPSKFMISIKTSMQKKGIKAKNIVLNEVDQMRDFRKIPTKRFVERLGVSIYDVDAPFIKDGIIVEKVTIPLKQHIGVAANPIVTVGQLVEKGDLIGDVSSGKIGAKVHASISGKVREINKQTITISLNS